MEVRLRADNFKSYEVHPWIGEVLHLKGSEFFLFTILYDKSSYGKNDVICMPKDLMAMMKCSRQTVIKATNRLKSTGLIYKYEKKTEEGTMHCYRINMDKIKPLEKEIKEYNEQLQKEYEALENGGEGI